MRLACHIRYAFRGCSATAALNSARSLTTSPTTTTAAGAHTTRQHSVLHAAWVKARRTWRELFASCVLRNAAEGAHPHALLRRARPPHHRHRRGRSPPRRHHCVREGGQRARSHQENSGVHASKRSKVQRGQVVRRCDGKAAPQRRIREREACEQRRRQRRRHARNKLECHASGGESARLTAQAAENGRAAAFEAHHAAAGERERHETRVDGGLRRRGVAAAPALAHVHALGACGRQRQDVLRRKVVVNHSCTAGERREVSKKA